MRYRVSKRYEYLRFHTLLPNLAIALFCGILYPLVGLAVGAYVGLRDGFIDYYKDVRQVYDAFTEFEELELPKLVKPLLDELDGPLQADEMCPCGCGLTKTKAQELNIRVGMDAARGIALSAHGPVR